jgi:APA family basic amino acid/polyamine antiporter
MGVIFCSGMAYSLPTATWLRLVLWSALGILVYFVYGYKHSRLRETPEPSAHAAAAKAVP